ncbi:MAG: hypothetical protein HY900_17545 [Deltaproteobacteria bacterium]|nr:hypothetical protein [Deltaproteobacteria bacterium]
MTLGTLRSALRGSLAARICAWLVAAVVLLVISMDLLFLRLQSDHLREQFLQEGATVTRLLAQTVRPAVLSEDIQALSVPVEAVLYQEDVRAVAVYNLERQLISRKRAEAEEVEPYPPSPSPPPPPAQGGLGYRETKDSFAFWQPVRAEDRFASEEELFFPPENGREASDRPIGFVAVTLSKNRLKRALQASTSGALLVGGLFFMVGGLGSVIVVRHAVRPLRRLVQEVKASTGPAAEEQPSELGFLSRTYERFVQELDGAFETIRELNEGLERKVRERTHELETANAELAERRRSAEEANRTLSCTLAELRETQAQLIQAEKMAALGQLVAGVAHEVNNSVNFISGALPVLQSLFDEIRAAGTAAGPGADRLPQRLRAADQLMANIGEGARRAAQIVRDLRDFARVEQTEFAVADLHHGIESTLQLLHQEYRDRIEVRKEYAESLPRVECLPGQINQVFMNLLRNAAQAIPDRGTVTIRTWSEADRVHICFADDGPGIPAELVPRIFDPFFTTKDVGKGTGLGLGISYGIVRRHGGEILVRSREGEGAEFEIVLPIIRATPPHAEA